MKSIHATAQARLDSPTPRFSTAWIIKLQNGTILRFTSHDEDVTFSGQSATTPNGISVDGTYIAAVGYRTGSLQQGNDGSVDNMEVRAILNLSGITQRDLQGGLYNDAEVYLFGFFWDDLTIPIVKLPRGHFGEFTVRRGESVIEFRELQSLLHQRIGRTVKPSCDADLGDARCRFDLSSLTVSGTVSSSTDRTHFSGSVSGAADYYRFGVVTWTSGANAGLEMEVKAQSGGSITLYEAMPYRVEAGDGYTISPGCDKLDTTCIDKFDNILNFQGSPHVPGVDAQLNPPNETE